MWCDLPKNLIIYELIIYYSLFVKKYLTFYFPDIFRFINIKIFLKKKFPNPIWSQHEYSEYISENLACVLNYIFKSFFVFFIMDTVICHWPWFSGWKIAELWFTVLGRQRGIYPAQGCSRVSLLMG